MKDMTVKTIIKRNLIEPLKNLYWMAYGSVIVNPSESRLVSSMLFVCKGNICRSAFAEYYAKKLISGRSTCVIQSAGLEVSKSLSPPPAALVAAEALRIKMDGHKSKGIDQEMLQSVDMIIVMEVGQYQYLRRHFPAMAGKIYILPLFDPDCNQSYYYKFNIQDPYGQTVEEFKTCFLRISRCVERLCFVVDIA